MRSHWLGAICIALGLTGCLDDRPVEGVFESTPSWREGRVLLNLTNGHAVMIWLDTDQREVRRQEFTVEPWSGGEGLQLNGSDHFVLTWNGSRWFSCLGCAAHIPYDWSLRTENWPPMKS